MSNAYGLIYMHTNKITGLSYIGQTIKTMEYRFRSHVLEAKRKGSNDSYFHRALNKYDTSVWVSVVLEDTIDVTELDAKEQYFIDKYNTYCSGYNMTLGGLSGKGCTPSKETRAKLAEAGRGRVVTTDTRHKISMANKGKKNRLGHTNSDEHRDKISSSRLGINNPGFKAWSITKPDGTYEEYTDITKTQYAINTKLPIKAFCTRFGKDKAGKVGKSGPFKGWTMENL